MIAKQDQLTARLVELLESMEVVAPVRERGRVYFRTVRSSDDIAWDYGTSVNSIKEFFLPPRQVLFRYASDGFKTVSAIPEKPRLIFLARPCDARALTIMDKVFLGNRPDETYAALRERSTIVGVACDSPDEHCFCTSVGGSPAGTEGMDAILIPTEDGSYDLKVLSDKGRAIFPYAPDDDTVVPEEFVQKAEAAIQRRVTVPENIRDSFASDYWREVSETCLKCGLCAHLCPTCHCFDIVEEGDCRVRCWDYCQSDTFTRIAAGHDHRAEKFSRCRNRVYHKFDYYPENFGVVACVGCGRCARHCPVNNGIADLVSGVHAR